MRFHPLALQVVLARSGGKNAASGAHEGTSDGIGIGSAAGARAAATAGSTMAGQQQQGAKPQTTGDMAFYRMVAKAMRESAMATQRVPDRPRPPTRAGPR